MTSRYLTEEGRQSFAGHSTMEILFNYLGMYQQLERDDSLFQSEQVGGGGPASDISPALQRLGLFEISVLVMQGTARFEFAYNKHMRHQDKIRQWMASCERSLVTLVGELSSIEADRTLTDFPLLSLDYRSLERLKKETLPAAGINTWDEVEDVYPCSPMQQGLLLSQNRNADTYKVQFMFKVEPADPAMPVNPERLATSWQRVINRHSMLRAIFINSVAEGGIFDHVILKEHVAHIRYAHCTDETAVDALRKLDPIDVTTSQPQHLFTICTTHSGAVYCRLDISHALIDAGSVSIILDSLSQAYESELSLDHGSPYSNYIKYLQGRSLESSMKYWMEHLDGVEPCHFPLATGKQTIEGAANKLSSVKVDLGDASKNLRAFCDASSVTVPNFFQFIWCLILQAYTGSSDVSFGYLASGRDVPVPGIGAIVGPLISMMVCRLNIIAGRSVSELLQDLQGHYAAGLEHQHCSLAQIHHGLGLSGKPLFNTVLSVQRAPSASQVETNKLSFSSVGAHDPTEVSR